MPDAPSRSLTPLGALLVTLGATVLVLAGMRAAAPIVGPLLIALLITIAWSPASRWLQQRGWPPTVAALTGIVVSLIGLALLVALVWSSLLGLQERLPEYEPRVAALQESGAAWLARLPFDADRLLSAEAVQPDALVGYALGLVGGVTEAVGALALLGLIMIFMMLESVRYPEKLESVLSATDQTRERITSFGKSMRSYIVINTAFGLIAGVMNTLLLLALGVDFAILWGVLSFLLSFVPNVGVLVSLVPPALMALLQFGLGRALIVAAGFFAINFVVDAVIKPRFVGESLNLAPIVVVISLVFWGWLLGPIGALVAVPLSIAAKFLFEGFDDSRWLAALMSDRPSSDAPPAST